MTFKNTTTEFGLISKSLHWGVILIFLAQFFLAGTMKELPNDGAALGMSKWALHDLHKSLGVLVLLLGIFRIYWRVSGVLPEWKQALSTLEARLVGFTEWGLLSLMIAMPATGYLMSNAGGFPVKFFGLFTLPAVIGKSKAAGELFHELHGICAMLVMVIVALHLGLILKRTLVNKDRFIFRMISKQ